MSSLGKQHNILEINYRMARGFNLVEILYKTAFSPGTHTLHLINKIKIQISQRNSYNKHFHEVHNDKYQTPIC